MRRSRSATTTSSAAASGRGLRRRRRGRALWIELEPTLAQTLEERLGPRDDRDLEARLFPDVRADALRTAIGRACRASGTPLFSPHDLRHRRISLLHLRGVPWAWIAEFVGQRSLKVTADTYTHVDGRTRARLLDASGLRLTYGAVVVIRYHGNAAITQGPISVEGDRIIEAAGDPVPGPDPEWSGRLSDPAPTVNLEEGGAWLRLENGRECEVEITRAVLGSGLVEFSGAAGILDLR